MRGMREPFSLMHMYLGGSEVKQVEILILIMLLVNNGEGANIQNLKMKK